MSYIRKFLDLSTGHLRQSTRDLLDANAGPGPRYEHPDGYGWLVYAPDPEVQREWLADNPEHHCLAECLNLAREFDCDYVLFDRDAGFHPDLPTYDGEEVEA